MRILAICPTIYQEKCDKMYNSYEVTSSKYTKLLIINKKGSITKLLNEAFEKHNDYDFYIPLNDDILFQTPLWDTTLAKKHTISYGDDGLQHENLPTFPMIDGDFVRALGWLQMPTLHRYAGDCVWKFIGENTGTLRYVPEVKITHNWDGCAEPMTNTLDMEKFSEWLPRSHDDINKIKEILCKNTTA